MDTTTRNALAIIDEMVALRMQLAAIASQIESLKPAFFDACAALDTTPIKLDSAVISRKLTFGQWDYPNDILEKEQRLKQLKQQFQTTHEPTGGRQISWSIRLLV
jgi:hypothetical protein